MPEKITEPEVWKHYVDGYYVSSLGRVKHVFKNGREHLLVAYMKEKSVCVKVLNKHEYVGRLVWKVFRGEIPDEYVVRHKNGCVTMNELYNLELVSFLEFVSRPSALRRKVIDLDTGHVYASTVVAGRELFCSPKTIGHICNKKFKTSCVNVEWYDADRIYPMELKFVMR